MPFKNNEERRAHYAQNREYINARNRRYRQANPERRMAWTRKYNHGITDIEFNAMIENQAGLCAMCTNPMSPGVGTHVDHDHKTGKIRGLLCNGCNTALGRFEKPFAIIDATSYLEASR